MTPLTSIVILTLNELGYTRRCVDSVRACTPEPFEFVFVDNGSTDGTVEYLRSIEGATVIANDVNRGFGGGCNQGIAASCGERVLLLNNDTVVTAGWLAAMHAALDADPTRGIAGPRSNHVADAQKVDEVGYDQITLEGLDAFAEAFVARSPGAGFSMPRVIGFCMLVRREVIDRVGGFDVRFGLGNFEDDDLCLRAAVAGWGSWVCDDSFVHHFGSRTFAGAGIGYGDSLEGNWRKFTAKWNLGRAGADHVRKVYYPGHVIERTTFDVSDHYAPLVAAPHEGEVVHIERRGTALLVAADRRDNVATREMFAAASSAFGPDDDLTIVVRLDPSDATSLGLLEQAADTVGDEHVPDIVVVEVNDANDEAAIRACDAVLCHGDSAYALAGLAHWCGRAVVGIEDLHELARTLARPAA